MRHGRDEANALAGFLHAHIARRAARAVIRIFQRPVLLEPRPHKRQWQILIRAIPGDIAHRHRLNQTEIKAVFTAPGDHAVIFMLIHAFQRDSIDLDGKPGGLGGENAIQSLFNLAPARDGGEGIRIQSI